MEWYTYKVQHEAVVMVLWESVKASWVHAPTETLTLAGDCKPKQSYITRTLYRAASVRALLFDANTPSRNITRIDHNTQEVPEYG